MLTSNLFHVYLPIIFKMLNLKNEEIEVQGLLTEFGNLITNKRKQTVRFSRSMNKYFKII
jgi:hypothetical protein